MAKISATQKKTTRDNLTNIVASGFGNTSNKPYGAERDAQLEIISGLLWAMAERKYGRDSRLTIYIDVNKIKDWLTGVGD